MRSRITVGIFSIMIALCSLSIGGCSGNSAESSEKNTQSNIGQIINNYDNSPTSEKSESSSDNPLSDIILGTPPAPNGEPTIFVGLDGKPIYTSEITELKHYSEPPITADKITADDYSASIKCEGFQYFKKPTGKAYNNYKDPELFDGLDFIGEKPENNAEWERVNVGDSFCGLKLVKAYSQFEIYPDVDTYYIPGSLNGVPCAEFEGRATIEGFLLVSPRTSYEPDGGELRFTPTENLLPIIGDTYSDETFNTNCVYLTDELYSFNECGMIGSDYSALTYKDIDGMDIGDAAFVRVTISSLCYYGPGVVAAEFEYIEVLSDVLVHIDDYI